MRLRLLVIFCQIFLCATINANSFTDSGLVNNTANALPQQRVLLDVGTASSRGGAVTTSPDVNGHWWNNMEDAKTGSRVNNIITTTNAPTSLTLEVVNRIDGTYEVAAPGTNGGNTIGAVGEYPATATTDFAFSSGTEIGKWRFAGLNATKSYTFKFWGTRNSSFKREIEIKFSSDTAWKSYDAWNNTNFNTAVSFIVTGKTQVDFDIRTKTGSQFGYINVVDISFDASAANNQPPVATAGADQGVVLPVTTTKLIGVGSDADGTIRTYAWTKLSGPTGGTVVNPSSATTQISSLVEGQYKFEFIVTDDKGSVGKDTLLVNVYPYNATAWPTLATPTCNQSYKIVVLGSSSAYGVGASPIDSSWVSKFTKYVQLQNPQTTVVNLAASGAATYHICPTGYLPPANRPTPMTTNNITKAMSLAPDAIILNLPSNDINYGYTVQEIKDNFDRIVAAANNIPVWVTTTQPRGNFNATQRSNQMLLRDWIMQRYGNKAVDCWATVALADGFPNPVYLINDSTHLNNFGHDILFKRVVSEKIWDSVCARRGTTPVIVNPVAKAGADQWITWPQNHVVLDGRSSYAPSGVINAYVWKKISGPALLSTLNTKDTVGVSLSAVGVYTFSLTVTDNNSRSVSDTVKVTVNAALGTSKSLRVNLFNGSVPYNNAQWNNWQPVANSNSAVFKYEDGTASSVFVNLSAHSRFLDNGSAYGSGATVCPKEVLRFNSQYSGSRTFTIKGLNPARRYRFEFYASRSATSGNKTIIKTGSVADTINTDTNLNDYAKFSALMPASSGTIVFTITQTGSLFSYNYLAGFAVIEQALVSGREAVVLGKETTEVNSPLDNIKPSLTIIPNPVINTATLQLTGFATGAGSITITDVTGKIEQSIKLSLTNKLTNKTLDLAGLARGVYLVNVRTADGSTIVQKIVKQ